MKSYLIPGVILRNKASQSLSAWVTKCSKSKLRHIVVHLKNQLSVGIDVLCTSWFNAHANGRMTMLGPAMMMLSTMTSNTTKANCVTITPFITKASDYHNNMTHKTKHTAVSFSQADHFLEVTSSSESIHNLGKP